MVFSQYRETYEVLRNYPTLEHENIKDYAKMVIRNLLHANSCVHSRRLISEFSEDGIKCIQKLQSHCANMNFADKSRYDRIFKQVTHKGGESAINYIKRFHHAHALSVSVGNSYSEDQLMHTFLNNFRQVGKYCSQISSHQAKFRREEEIKDQKSLNISSLQTDFLKLDSSSVFGRNSERAHAVQTKCSFTIPTRS